MGSTSLVRPDYPEEYSFPVGKDVPVGRYNTISEFVRKAGLRRDLEETKVDLPIEEFDRGVEAVNNTPNSAEDEFDWIETALLGVSDNYLNKLFSNKRSVSSENHFSKLRADLISAEATKQAVDTAITSGDTYNIGGGHHHAHRGGSSDYKFNLINDLLVGIERAKQHSEVQTTMVVDLDVHFGDGTVSGTRMSEDDCHFSMHQWNIFPRVDSGWKDYTGSGKAKGSIKNIPLPEGTAGETYLDILDNALNNFVDNVDPDLILYQSGVDTHHEDKLGGLKLSLDDLYERDSIVYDISEDIPVVTVTGGGYGPESGYASVNTIAATIGREQIFEEKTLAQPESVERKLRKWYNNELEA